MKTHDDVLDEFFRRLTIGGREASVLEKLRCDSSYFSLEWRRGSNRQLTYVMSLSLPDVGESEFSVQPPDLANILRGGIPFIPELLVKCGKDSWAEIAQAMHSPDPEKSFLYDALSLSNAKITLQFDWADAQVPDGFKLGAQFTGEMSPTYYALHNDVVAVAVETRQSMLKLALGVCPPVATRLLSSEPDLLAAWESIEFDQATLSTPVAGHRKWM